jgi:hypothetical protein
MAQFIVLIGKAFLAIFCLAIGWSAALAAAQDDAAKSNHEPAAGNWPQWRGPNRDNVSTETGLLTQWPEGGPPLLWSVRGLGEGIAPVTIAGGRIYTLAGHDRDEYVVTLDEQTGNRRMSRRARTSFQILTQGVNDHAATPLVHTC